MYHKIWVQPKFSVEYSEARCGGQCGNARKSPALAASCALPTKDLSAQMLVPTDSGAVGSVMSQNLSYRCGIMMNHLTVDKIRWQKSCVHCTNRKATKQPLPLRLSLWRGLLKRTTNPHHRPHCVDNARGPPVKGATNYRKKSFDSRFFLKISQWSFPITNFLLSSAALSPVMNTHTNWIQLRIHNLHNDVATPIQNKLFRETDLFATASPLDLSVNSYANIRLMWWWNYHYHHIL